MLSVATLLAGACGLFEPRQAPPPCNPDDPGCRPPADFKEPIVPEFVRDNIKAALEAPTIDPNYRDSLSNPSGPGRPGFLYIPDAGAEAAAQEDFFVGWLKDREVQFMLNELEGPSAPKAVQMNFTQFEDTGELPGTDEARFEVRYEFVQTFSTMVVDTTGAEPDTSFVDVDEGYCGRAFWDLEGGDRNFWTLKQWEDLEPLPNPSGPCEGTLGLLRATSGQGS